MRQRTAALQEAAQLPSAAFAALRRARRTVVGLSMICSSFSFLTPCLVSQEQPNSVALEALSRLKGIDLESNPAIKDAVLKVLEEVKGTPQFVEIVRDFKIPGQESALLEFASKQPSSSAAAEAMRIVLHRGETNMISRALDGTNAAPIAEALGNAGEKEIVPLLAPRLNASHDALFRQKAAHALAGVREGAEALLQFAKEQKLQEDVRLLASLELNNVRWPEIKSEAASVLPMPATQNAELLPPVSQLINMTGEPIKGAAVFRRDNVGCIKCHQVGGEGIDFGPNLSEIGSKLGKDALLESILNPSAGIAFGYEAWQLEFKNGDEAYGLISSETEAEITIKAIGGISARYKKADIERRARQKLSIMPAGLQQNMSTKELVDLIEYLTTLKKGR